MAFRWFLRLSFQFLAVDGFHHAARSLREFDLRVTWGQHDQVGISKESFLINDLSPGPVLEIDEDDWVTVRVQNDSPFNITIHFHGIEMHGTPWSDGVPGLSQWPIQPGMSFLYGFRATQYGSYWYHGHYRGQLEDGLLGAMVIHPKRARPKMFHMISNDTEAVLAMEAAERHVRPLLISDWSPLKSNDRWNIALAARVEISCYDALLLNGKGRIECLGDDTIRNRLTQPRKINIDRVPGASFTDKGCLPPEAVALVLPNPKVSPNASNIPEGIYSGCSPTQGSIEVITLPDCGPSGECWVALDIIAATSFIRGIISIDEHDMYVYAMDGSYIEAQKVQALDFTNGDRYSVLVKADRPGAYNIRVSSTSALQMLTAHALLSVDGSVDGSSKRQGYIDSVGELTSPDVIRFDAQKTVPFQKVQIAQSADETYFIYMYQEGATYLWALNSTGLMPKDFEDETPVLLDPGYLEARGNTTITTRNGTWVDLVFTTTDVGSPAHPIHKHGNHMYQIGSGTGSFIWATVDEAIRDNPQLFDVVDPPPRDTILTPAAAGDVAWTVVRYQVMNPGPWLLHCHINNHMMGGMSMIIKDGVDAWPVDLDRASLYEGQAHRYTERERRN